MHGARVRRLVSQNRNPNTPKKLSPTTTNTPQESCTKLGFQLGGGQSIYKPKKIHKIPN
jgi:hypothetical protein